MRKMIYITMVLGVLYILAYPVNAYADRDDNRGRDRNWSHDRGNDRDFHFRNHPHWGTRVTVLPRHSSPLWVGRSRYYYYDGIYYTYSGLNYVVASPPIGAIVTAVPADYQPVTINGVTYYFNDGVYYVNNGYGYQVVPQPVEYQAPVVAVQTSPAQTSAPAPVTPTETESLDVFTVNIPNDKGGFTTVDIKKSGKGFTGPQGEFYDTFPKVAQLKLMYGK